MIYCINCSSNYFVYQYLVWKERRSTTPKTGKHQMISTSKESSSTFYVETPMWKISINSSENYQSSKNVLLQHSFPRNGSTSRSFLDDLLKKNLGRLSARLTFNVNFLKVWQCLERLCELVRKMQTYLFITMVWQDKKDMLFVANFSFYYSNNYKLQALAQAPQYFFPKLQVSMHLSIPSWQCRHPGTTASVAALQSAQSPHCPSQSKVA